MKTLLVSIYRSDYNSELNHFHELTRTHLICQSGPFDLPKEGGIKIIQHPASAVGGPYFNPIAIPIDADGREIEKKGCCRMFVGTYICTSDSRFREEFGSSPIALHDRFEPFSH